MIALMSSDWLVIGGLAAGAIGTVGLLWLLTWWPPADVGPTERRGDD